MKWPLASMFIIVLQGLTFASILADVPEELQIKRETIFEFEVEPKVTKSSKQVVIEFTTKSFCDVTVAVETKNGDIIRHLASGVLGQNAPSPFLANSKRQTVIWDLKNDQGAYEKNVEELAIRVSLGLKPQYEKSLYWEPKKRLGRGGTGKIATEDPIPVATEQGVYLYDGNGADFVKLFDHKGRYLRTVYPFPANKIEDVEGLVWVEYPQGYKRPQKNGINLNTFLNNGTEGRAGWQASSFTMAIQPGLKGNDVGNIALVKVKLNRIATDGGSAKLPSGEKINFNGPKTYLELDPKKPFAGKEWDDTRVVPYSSAFSPDGKKLYLTGFCHQGEHGKSWQDGVMVMNYDQNESPKAFVGEFKNMGGVTASVACDDKGRVYVSDYSGHAVNVYSPEGKLLKKIPFELPTHISINPKNGELYIFSWYVGGRIWKMHPGLVKYLAKEKGEKDRFPKGSVTILKSFDDPKVLKRFDLPITNHVRLEHFGNWGDTSHGTQYRATVDFWSDKPIIWLITKSPMQSLLKGTEGLFDFGQGWADSGPILFEVGNNELNVVGNFSKDTEASVSKLHDNLGHQRIYMNPSNKKLYLTDKEDNVGGGEFKHLWEIDTNSGKLKKIPLPLSTAEDLAFDLNGLIYLRQIRGNRHVVRYEMNPWREVPWDYGNEAIDKKGGDIISGLPIPQNIKGTGWQSQGGMWVAPNGNLAVWSSVKNNDPDANVARNWEKKESLDGETKYKPLAYPGRSTVGCVHIWDKHGKPVLMDAAPGVDMTDGIALDNDNNLYLMVWTSRVYNNKRYFNRIAGTLLKVKAGQNKSYTFGAQMPIPLTEKKFDRPYDLSGYTLKDTWVEGAEWFYGGVGNSPFKVSWGCICWSHSRFTMDYFSRSFAPEVDQFSVAVIDKSGNLITRIGKYGNVDDGVPSDKNGAFNSPNPRSIGDDEVALMHGAHVATLSDKHLYIYDVGNGRIQQVKLGYHKDVILKLE